jgi:TPR repeat protein
MFCTECGTRSADTAKFCANCGTKLFNEEAVTENNEKEISDANVGDSKNINFGEIDSFFKSDTNYFKDLPNDVVIKAAENGNMYAQMDMMRRYLAFDDETGCRIWGIMALPDRINIAKQGDFEEQISLGYAYRDGTAGAEKNENEYKYWHKTAFNDSMKAAEQGDAMAQCNLGKCFDMPYGTNEDIEEAIYWFEKAAEQGNSDAMWQLRNIYEDETSENYDENKEEYVLKYLEFHDDNKANYWEKKYDARLAEEAVENFHKLKEAAEQGDACKQSELANCYFNGSGVGKNTENADLWWGWAFSGFEKAAEQGDARAQIQVGHCYWYGKGVQKDRQIALMWYKRAAEQGNNESMMHISICYKTEGNDYEYRHWLKKSAEQGNEYALAKIGFDKSLKECKEILERSGDWEEERRNIIVAVNEPLHTEPQDGFRNIMGSLLNDVDIIEVMKNPKEAVLEFGFNAVKKLFEENTIKK